MMVSLIWFYAVAIALLVKHVVRLEEPRSKSSMLLHIGMLYLELGEEQEASRYFVEGLTIVEAMELEYAPQFLTILQVIQRQETPMGADYWIQNFTDRVVDHPKFKRMITGLELQREGNNKRERHVRYLTILELLETE